jgi:hypothetical protein
VLVPAGCAQLTVSGDVRDNSSQQPIAKVSVTIAGTNTATATDNGGHFSIDVPSGNQSLLFTNVGYKKQTVAVGSQKTFNIFLEPSFESLDQVVLVGYGTQKRGDVTGAISTPLFSVGSFFVSV